MTVTGQYFSGHGVRWPRTHSAIIAAVGGIVPDWL